MSSSSASAAGLAGRYASALFELAREEDVLERVGADLEQMQQLLDQHPDLAQTVASPAVSAAAKIRVVEAVGAKAGLADVTVKFLGVLGEHDRLGALPSMIDAFAAMLAETRGEVAVEVVSAIPLGATQEATVREMLAQSLGKKITLNAAVDPELLGGLVVRVGSRMIDASLRTKLRHLELAMRGAD